MKRLTFLALLGLGIASLARAETAVEEAVPASAYEPVDVIPALLGFWDFDVIDNDTLILWTTPFRPYLVELAYPSPDIRFAHAIRVESATKLVHARFDSVRIRGLRYPIAEIFKVTRDEARRLRSGAGTA